MDSHNQPFSRVDLFYFVCEQRLGDVPQAVIYNHLLARGVAAETVSSVLQEADRSLAHESTRQVIIGANLLRKRDQRSSSVADAERHFRRAITLSPNDANAWSFLGSVLARQGRHTEALVAHEKALSLAPDNPRSLAGKSTSLEAIAPIPEQDIQKTGANRLLYTRFPETLAAISDLDVSISEHILQHINPDALSINKSTKVVTVGSCFAANVSLALKAQGVDAINLTIGEAANSTYANRMIVENALKGVTIGERFIAKTLEQDSIASSLRAAHVLIYTLGVAPCFFDAQTGEFVPSNGAESVRSVARGKTIFRNTTVEENVSNLLAVVDGVRAENPECQFVFSLSPVPMHATLEKRSAMEADCLSKSILRVTAEQVVSLRPRCLYWPAFEVVRWLGAYIPGMYGKEDGTPHHVSEDVIGVIMQHFIRIFYKPA